MKFVLNSVPISYESTVHNRLLKSTVERLVNPGSTGSTGTVNINSNYSQTSYSRKGLTNLKSTVTNNDSPPSVDPPFEQSPSSELQPPSTQDPTFEQSIPGEEHHAVEDPSFRQSPPSKLHPPFEDHESNPSELAAIEDDTPADDELSFLLDDDDKER